MSACEIISLYSQVNQRCIESAIALNKPKPREFVELTRIMCEIKAILKVVTLRLKATGYRMGGSSEEILTTFWSLYSQEEVLDIGIMTALYEMKTMP